MWPATSIATPGCLQGVSVPEQVVVRPDSLTTEQVRAEPVLEARRVMVQQMGWKPFVSSAQVIDDDSDDSGLPRRLLHLAATSRSDCFRLPARALRGSISCACHPRRQDATRRSPGRSASRRLAIAQWWRPEDLKAERYRFLPGSRTSKPTPSLESDLPLFLGVGAKGPRRMGAVGRRLVP